MLSDSIGSWIPLQYGPVSWRYLGGPAKADEVESSSSYTPARGSVEYSLKDTAETYEPSAYKAEHGLSDEQFHPEAHIDYQVDPVLIAAITEKVKREGK
jgi:hypothetical protein